MSVEITSERTQHQKVYANEDGTTTVSVSMFQHYMNGSVWEDVDLDYVSGQVLTNNVEAISSSDGIDFIDKYTGKGIHIGLLGAPSVFGPTAIKSHQGALWTWTNTPTGVKGAAGITSKFGGPKTFSWTFELVGTEEPLTVDEDGNLVGDGFLIPAPTYIATGGTELLPLAEWEIVGNTISFTYDDSPGDFPSSYAIDPTVVFNPSNSIDDGVASGSNPVTWPPASGASSNFTNSFLEFSASYTGTFFAKSVALLRFDTSSIPDGATVTSATLKLTKYASDLGVNANAGIVDIRYTSDFAPIGTEDYDASPSGTIAHNSTTLAAVVGDSGLVQRDYSLSNLGSISKTGYTAFKIHANVNSPPPSGNNYILVYSFDHTTASQRPILEVTYSNAFAQSVSGSLSFSGVSTYQNRRVRSLTGSLSFSGALGLVKHAVRSVAGTLTMAGTTDYLKVNVRSGTGSLDFSGTVSRKHIKAPFGGTLSFAGEYGASVEDARFTAGKDFDVTLAEYGFKVERGSIIKSDLTSSIPRINVATEGKKRSDFSELDTIAQETWTHGRGQYKMSDPAAFMDAEFLDTRISGQVIVAPKRTIHERTSNDPDMDGYVIDMIYWPATDKVYALVRGDVVADNKLMEWNETTDEWDTVAGANTLLTAANSMPTSMSIFSVPAALPSRAVTDYLVISRSDRGDETGLDYIYTTDGAAFTAGPSAGNGSKAAILGTFMERLAFDLGNAAVALRPDPTSDTDTIVLTNVGSPAERINSFERVGDILLVHKTAGAIQIQLNQDGTTYSTRPILDYAWGRDRDNGIASINFQGRDFYNVLESVYEFNGTTQRSIGPDLGAHEEAIAVADLTGVIQVKDENSSFQGPNEDKRGRVTGFASNSNFLFAAINGATVRTIMAYQGTGWHELTQLQHGESGGLWFFPRLSAAGFFSTPQLFYRDGDRLYSLKLPEGTDNRWDYTAADYEETGTPRMITSWVDADLPEVWKDWMELYVNMDFPDTNSNIMVEFQVDYDDTWYTLGTTYGIEPLRFPDNSNNSGHIRAQAIRLRFTFTGTPRLRSFFFRFISRPQPRYGWRMVLEASHYLDLVNGLTSETDSLEFSRQLWGLRQRGGPVRFDDGRADSGLFNYIKNPGFEGWDGATLLRWTEVGTPATTRNAQYKFLGGYSCKVVTVGANEGIVSDATGSLAAGTYHGVFRLRFSSGFVKIEILKDGVSVKEGIVSPTFGGSDYGSAGLANFKRYVLEYEAADAGQYQLRITAPSTGTTFYVDSVEFRNGPDDFSDYIAEGEPRCRPTTINTYFDTTAFRQPYWLVYLATVGEPYFQAHECVDEDDELYIEYETRMQIQLREAF